jgi:hypothetical protein
MPAHKQDGANFDRAGAAGRWGPGSRELQAYGLQLILDVHALPPRLSERLRLVLLQWTRLSADRL